MALEIQAIDLGQGFTKKSPEAPNVLLHPVVDEAVPCLQVFRTAEATREPRKDFDAYGRGGNLILVPSGKVAP